MSPRRPLALAAASLLFPLASALAQPQLRGATTFHANNAGAVYTEGANLRGAWRTNTPVVNQYIGLFLATSATPTVGDFLNDGTGNLAPVTLGLGDNTFYVFSTGIDPIPLQNGHTGIGLNLWFGGGTVGCADGPNVSAFAFAPSAGNPQRSDGTFAANGGQTAGQCQSVGTLGGANTLAYLGAPGFLVELTAFTVLNGMGGNRAPIDVVGATTLGGDGNADGVGSFTLRVTRQPQTVVPEPSTVLLLATGIVAVASVSRRRRVA